MLIHQAQIQAASEAVGWEVSPERIEAALTEYPDLTVIQLELPERERYFVQNRGRDVEEAETIDMLRIARAALEAAP